MYRTALPSLRLAAPRRTLYVTPAARKDINHKVGDTLAAGESCKRILAPIERIRSRVLGRSPADPDHERDAEDLTSQDEKARTLPVRGAVSDVPVS